MDLHRCPVDRGLLSEQGGELVCVDCSRTYPVIEGIPVLLPDIDEVQRIRGVTLGEQAARPSGDNASFYNDLERLNGEEAFEDYFESRGTAELMREAIRGTFESLGVDGPVVEIGAGEGKLAGIGDPYVAVDYSLLWLKRYLDPNLPRYCATAAALPFADASFAGVFSIWCFEHVPEADMAFAEVDRVLKPGGVAYLHPAWHCVQYNCDGLRVRPYRDLTLGQKLRKALIPLQKSRIFKAGVILPKRLLRRVGWCISRGETRMRFGRLRPDYTHRWCSDSDAISRIDSHEGCLFFASRGYKIIQPGMGLKSQLMSTNLPLIVVKPES